MTWVSDLKLENLNLRRSIGLRGLADYIATYWPESEQDKLIGFLQDPTKQTRIIIEVTEKKSEGEREL